MNNSERITLIRKIMGLDVAAFATLLSVSKSVVYRWESGMRQPHNSTLRLAEKFMDARQMEQLWNETKGELE